MICVILEKGEFLQFIVIGPAHLYMRDIGAFLILILSAGKIKTLGKGVFFFILSIGIIIVGVVLSRNLQFPFLMPLGYFVALGLLIYHCKVNRSSLFSGRIAIFFIFLVLFGAFLNGILANGVFKAGVSFRGAFYFLSFLFYYGVASEKNSVSDLVGYANIALLTALTMWILRYVGIVEASSIEADFGERYINAEETAFVGFACISYLSIFYNMRKSYWKFPLNKKHQILLLFVLSLCLIIAARHRTVWVSIIVSICVLFLFHYGKIALISRLILLVGLFCILFASGLIKADNNIGIAIKEATQFSEGNTFSWRVEMWQQLITAASVTNPISGSGYGRDMTVSHYSSPDNYYNADTSAHNLLIQVFGDAGLIGVIAFIILYLLPIVRSLRKIKYIGRGDASFICSLTAFWIMYSITYEHTIFTGISLAWGITGFITLYPKKEINAIA
jgi:O-antigen ligase